MLLFQREKLIEKNWSEASGRTAVNCELQITLVALSTWPLSWPNSIYNPQFSWAAVSHYWHLWISGSPLHLWIHSNHFLYCHFSGSSPGLQACLEWNLEKAPVTPQNLLSTSPQNQHHVMMLRAFVSVSSSRASRDCGCSSLFRVGYLNMVKWILWTKFHGRPLFSMNTRDSSQMKILHFCTLEPVVDGILLISLML